jgi:hypothetical protein
MKNATIEKTRERRLGGGGEPRFQVQLYPTQSCPIYHSKFDGLTANDPTMVSPFYLSHTLSLSSFTYSLSMYFLTLSFFLFSLLSLSPSLFPFISIFLPFLYLFYYLSIYVFFPYPFCLNLSPSFSKIISLSFLPFFSHTHSIFPCNQHSVLQFQIFFLGVKKMRQKKL